MFRGITLHHKKFISAKSGMFYVTMKRGLNIFEGFKQLFIKWVTVYTILIRIINAKFWSFNVMSFLWCYELIFQILQSQLHKNNA